MVHNIVTQSFLLIIMYC